MLDYLSVFSPIIALVINIISQVCIFRYVQRIGLLRSLFTAFGLGAGCLLFIELWSSSETILSRPSNIFIDIIIYSALSYCYFHFINLGETARRIRILRELYDSKEGLSMEGVIERYNAQMIIDVRLERLLKTNQIILRNGKYYIGNPIMLIIAKVITKLKIMILRKKVN